MFAQAMYSTAAALEFVDIHRSQSIRRAQSASATDAAASVMSVDDERWWEMPNGKSALMIRYEGALW